MLQSVLEYFYVYLDSMNSKKKFVYLTPLSFKAKVDFSDLMDSFHSCEIKEESNESLLVTTLNQKHTFWIPKKGNEHWKVTNK